MDPTSCIPMPIRISTGSSGPEELAPLTFADAHRPVFPASPDQQTER
jgi:hypothetical protein